MLFTYNEDAMVVTGPVIESPSGLRIGQLAERVGTTVKAIRYYEALGLLDPPRRAPNGYRVYSPIAIGQLQFIRRAKVLGLSLAEIKRLFDTAKAGESISLRAQVADLLDEKLDECERQIAELVALRDSLQKRRRLTVIAQGAPPCACHGFDVSCACLPVSADEVSATSPAASPKTRA
ncbi:MAG: heavy metal-responsive transcriptional regulator [Chloroflexi bacterium]|nr:heavy metal-responsive transcriptional regulator [Chloroflexota bacterium]